MLKITPEMLILMHSNNFQDIRSWLKSYIDRFVAGNGEADDILRLKWTHSLMVERLCQEISHELEWNPHDVAVAGLAGLLHDAGRFPQFAEFGTFNDAASFDHGVRGAEIVKMSGVLDSLAQGDRSRILESIIAHNRRDIPGDIPCDALPLAKLVRDADKLDIYRIIMERVRAGKYHEHLLSAVQIEQAGPATPGAIDEILRNGTVSNENIRTMADFGLMMASWVFDINYAPALQRILSEKYIEDITRCLPDEPGSRRAAEHVKSFVERSLESRGR